MRRLGRDRLSLMPLGMLASGTESTETRSEWRVSRLLSPGASRGFAVSAVGCVDDVRPEALEASDAMVDNSCLPFVGGRNLSPAILACPWASRSGPAVEAPSERWL